MEIKWIRVSWEIAIHEVLAPGRWNNAKPGVGTAPVWSTKTHGPHSYSRGRFCVILEQLLRFLCLPFPKWHWAPGNKDSRWMSAGRRVRSSCFIPSLLPIKGAITTNPHWATYDLCYLENKNMKTLETCYKCWSRSPCQETPYNGDYCSTRSIQRANLLKGLRQTYFRKKLF